MTVQYCARLPSVSLMRAPCVIVRLIAVNESEATLVVGRSTERYIDKKQYFLIFLDGRTAEEKRRSRRRHLQRRRTLTAAVSV